MKVTMASIQSSIAAYHSLAPNSVPQLGVRKIQDSFRSSRTGGAPILVRAEQSLENSGSHFQVRSGRRQLIAVTVIAPSISLINQASVSFAAETKKGYLPVMDKKDGYSFLYPFGWQEVVIEGQDKVFKDVIEPLESVSVNMIPTGKQDIREFGPPQEVAETLIKKVLAPPSQKTKLIEAKENNVDGRVYYTFEFVAKAPNYTRHALSSISIGNGKFYTLTTGANERRWEKMKDRLHTVVDSFKIVDV